MRMAHFQALAGVTRTVLVEKPGFGHSECFAPVAFDGAAPSGTLVSVLVTGTDGAKLLGRQAA